MGTTDELAFLAGTPGGEWIGALLVVINGGDLSKTPFRHVTIRSRIP